MTVIAAVPYPGGVAIATDLLLSNATDLLLSKGILSDLSVRDERIKLHRGNHMAVAYRGKFWADMEAEFDNSLTQLLATCTTEELLSGRLAEFNHDRNRDMTERARRLFDTSGFNYALALEIIVPYHLEGLVSVYHNGKGCVYYDAGNGSLAKLIRGGVLSPGREVEDYYLYDCSLPKSQDGVVEAVSSVVRHWCETRPDVCSGLEAVVITAAGVKSVAYEHISPQPAALIR